MQDSLQWQRYHELRDDFLNGTLADRSSQELETLVIENESLKRDFVDRLHMRAAIAIPTDSVPIVPPHTPYLLDDEAEIWYRSPRMWMSALAILAASVLMALGIRAAGFGLGNRGSLLAIATLVDAENCKWGPSSLSTIVGSELTEGRLVLESGIARLSFPKVTVTIEGPVDFEVVDQAVCRVNAGRAFAVVEPGGEGFRIDSPHASFVDLGTVFGIHVREEDDTELYLFSGAVTSTHLGKTEYFRKPSSGQFRFTRTEMINSFQLPMVKEPTVRPPGVSLVQLSTAVGGGWDEYIISQPGTPWNSSDTLLLSKHPFSDKVGEMFRRKIFLNFDMSLVDPSQLTGASLQLVSVKSPFGFAAFTPSTRFDVYGVLPPHDLGWQGGTITWEDSPASDDSWMGVDPSKTKLLGSFTVDSNNLDAIYNFTSDELVDFLAAKDNGVAILILVPAKVERSDSYVHAFASRRHPSLTPPTLRLTLVDQTLATP